MALGAQIAGGFDSSDLDDLPAPGQGTDLDDLSRGSVGNLDPIFGPYALPEGQYVLAVAPSTIGLSQDNSQFVEPDADNPFIRVEPVPSVRRVVDQTFDEDPLDLELADPDTLPEQPSFLDDTSAVPFNLADVTLFVSAPGDLGSNIWTADPYQGSANGLPETFVGTLLRDPALDDDGGGGGDGDLATIYNVADVVLAERQAPANPLNNDGIVDELLFGFTLGNTDANSGNYLAIDPGTALVTGVGGPDDNAGGGGGVNQAPDPESIELTDDTIVTYFVPPIDPDAMDAEPPEPEEADEGVQFEALALLELGPRNYQGFAVGNRLGAQPLNPDADVTSLDNILYTYNHGTGLAISAPAADREDDALRPPEGREASFGYSNIVERGVLNTEVDLPDPLGEPVPNENTALVVVAATDDGDPDIVDGMLITTSDGTTYELDGIPDGVINADPENGAAVMDGDEFFIGETLYEVEAGPSIVLADDLLTFLPGDQIAISDIRPEAPGLLIEFSADGATTNDPSAIPVSLDVEDVATLAASIVNAINASEVSAIARLAGDRISLEYEGGVSVTSAGASIEGATGLEGDDTIGIRMEQYFTSGQIVEAMLNTIPNSVASGNRIGFQGVESIDFLDLEFATELSNAPGVAEGNLPIGFQLDASAEQMAQVIAASIGNGAQASGRVVYFPQFLEMTFDDAPRIFDIAGEAPGGRITGMAFVGSRLLAVSDGGGLYEIMNYATPEGAWADYLETSVELDGISFSGLTLGPQTTSGGAYADLLFATDSSGELYAFTVDGSPQNVFANGAFSVPTGVSGANGLEFSSLEENLWAQTFDRAVDPGHGELFGFGGNSLHFGGERDIFFPGGAHGSVISNEVDLSQYTANDLPTLYFNYFFVAEEGTNQDAFRVFVSDDAAEEGRGEWQIVATSDVVLGADAGGAAELFTNSFADIPRKTRDAQFIQPPGAPYDTDRDDDIDLGPSGDRDTFPFTGTITGTNPEQPRTPFPGNANITEPEDWLPYTMLDEREGVWRQARVDLAPFAGSGSLRFRFDFSTAGSFDLGNFGGIELKAIDADRLTDGETFSVDGVTFEIDLGLTINTPSGASVREGEIIFLIDNDGNEHRLELDGDEFVTEGNIAVPYVRQASAEDLAISLATALGEAGISSTVVGNRVGIDADNALVQDNSRFTTSGGGVGRGVAPGNVPVELSIDMTGDDVARELAPVFADTFTDGNAAAFAVAKNLVRLHALEVDNPGPFGLADSLPQDDQGQFSNAASLGPALRGMNNEFRYYDFDEDNEEDPRAINPNLIVTDPNGNQQDLPVDFITRFEGLYVDDIIIGFRTRGEILEDHRVPHPFSFDENELPRSRDNRVPNLFDGGAAGAPELILDETIVTGEYTVEIRVVQQDEEIFLQQLDRGVPNVTLLAPTGTQIFDGKIFQINDGRTIVTFEYNDLGLGEADDVSSGNVPVNFNISDTAFTIATAIRDAINSTDLKLTAASANGEIQPGVTSSRSDRVNLFGTALVVALEEPNGIDFIQSALQAGAGNRERSQGQLIITQSTVSNSERHGVIVEDALRDLPSYEWTDPLGLEQHSQFQEGDYIPQPGPVRNTREINRTALTTGVVISNNIIAFNEEGGIKYGGDPNGYILTAPFAADPPGNNLEVWDELKFSITDHNNQSRTFEFHDLQQADPGVPGTDWEIDNVPIFFRRENTITAPVFCVYNPTPPCEGRYAPDDLDVTDRVQEAIERSNLDLNVYRGKGYELFVEGASFIGLRAGDIPSFSISSFVSRVQTGAIPFGRIVNNTVVGLGGRFTDTRVDEVTSIDPTATDTVLRVVNDYQDVGIDIGDNADPTLLNNVVVNFEIGVQSDFSTLDTVREGLVFQGNSQNTQNTNLGDFATPLDLDDPLFVDLLNGNFYPAAGSTIIDSSIDSLEDRPELVTVKEPLGIARSPIIAPGRDVLGQLREDDPSVEPENGVGRNAFKDRGAIDRVDFLGPQVSLLTPRDNDALGIDQNPANTVVTLDPENRLSQFEIQFTDTTQRGGVQDGTGLDPFSVTSESVVVTRDATLLTEGVDFVLDVDAINGIVRLIPAGGEWPIGSTYVITLNQSIVQDVAGNPIQDNQAEGGVEFTVSLELGTDFGDAPLGYPVASHEIVSGLFLGGGVTPETGNQASPDAAADIDNGVLLPVQFLRNETNVITVQASADGVLDGWFDFNQDGDWNDVGERVFSGLPIVAGANELDVNIPSDALSGQVFARFRFSSSGAPGVAGNVLDGEVEDYAVFVDLGNIWQNQENPLDVNNDGFVSSRDVLLIIQEINNPVASDLSTGELAVPAVDPNTPEEIGFVDVSGDGFVTARDALLVISAINDGNTGGSGEPEDALATIAQPVTVDPIGEIMENPVVQLGPPPTEALDLDETDALAVAIAADTSDTDEDVFSDLDWLDDV